jgi:hypothetical protein
MMLRLAKVEARVLDQQRRVADIPAELLDEVRAERFPDGVPVNGDAGWVWPGQKAGS